MVETIRGESDFDPTNTTGDGGTSIGLVQIHMPDHPEVTRDEALDPQFSLRFMAQAFKDGHQRWWTVWRDKFGP